AASDSEGAHSAWIWGLRAESSYTAIAKASSATGQALESESVEFTTGALPEGMPKFEVSDHDPTRAHDSMIVFGTMFGDTPVYVGVDPEGEVIWYHQIDQVVPRFNGDATQISGGRLLLHRRDGLQIIQP